MRGPAAATFGTACSQSCWQAPPITSRSPCPSQKDSAWPPPRGRSWNGRGRADADDGDERVDLLVAHPVAVPRHAVGARAVVVAPDRVERPLVDAGQRVPHLVEHGQRDSGITLGLRPPPDEPGLLDHPVVHGHGALAPRQPGDQLREHVIRPVQPPREVIDPARRIEVDAPQAGHRGIETRFASSEQAGLPLDRALRDLLVGHRPSDEVGVRHEPGNERTFPIHVFVH